MLIIAYVSVQCDHGFNPAQDFVLGLLGTLFGALILMGESA
jgi:hypothetical protein